MISCESDNDKCTSGYQDRAWNFVAATGVPTAQCVPYVSSDPSYIPTCMSNCDSPLETMVRYRCLPGSVTRLIAWNDMKKRIMNTGPINSAFKVYEDFFNYSSGVY